MRRVLSPLTWGFIFCIVWMWLFDATVTWGQKPRGKDIYFRTLDQHWIPCLRTLKDTHTTQSFHVYTKSHLNTRPSIIVQENPQLFSSKRERQLWILLKGMHEAIANPQTPQSTIHGQFIALQREEVQIHLPLHRHKFHKALNLDKSLDPSHPPRTVFTMQWSHELPACRKETQTITIEKEWNGREICSWWR